MCDPTGISEAALIGLAVSAVATGASVYAQNEANNAAEKARNNAIFEETSRQDELANEAKRNLAATTEDFSQANQNKQLADAANRREAAYQAVIPESPGVETFGLTRNQPKVVGDTFAREADQSQSRTSDYASKMAMLNAFGDSNFQNNVNLLSNSQKMNTITALSNGSSGLLDLDLMNAARAGDGWKFAGDIFGGIGSVAGAYATGQPKVTAGSLYPTSKAPPIWSAVER